jgi:hypothetical protein
VCTVSIVHVHASTHACVCLVAVCVRVCVCACRHVGTCMCVRAFILLVCVTSATTTTYSGPQKEYVDWAIRTYNSDVVTDVRLHEYLTSQLSVREKKTKAGGHVGIQSLKVAVNAIVDLYNSQKVKYPPGSHVSPPPPPATPFALSQVLMIFFRM